jgi:triacylglycerol esterase/lipase EstA (alpha/beta hydrolase family)
MTNWKLVLIGAALSVMPIGVLDAKAEPPSHFVRQSPDATTLIVFVHGVLGDGQSTWTKGTAYWPSLLSSDPAFNGADIFVYSYSTTLWATLSPDELAENMRLQLNANGVARYQHPVFLAHSLGGLVTRAYLLKNRDVASRTSFIYFFLRQRLEVRSHRSQRCSRAIRRSAR